MNEGAIVNASFNKLENQGEEINLACFLAFGSIKQLKWIICVIIHGYYL